MTMILGQVCSVFFSKCFTAFSLIFVGVVNQLSPFFLMIRELRDDRIVIYS